MASRNIHIRVMLLATAAALFLLQTVSALAALPFSEKGEKKSWDFQKGTVKTFADFWRCEGGSWEVSDEAGTQGNRMLRQTKVERKPAFYCSLRAFTNFDFSVRLRAENDDSKSRNWQVGVLFRRKDPDRYYKLRLTVANIALVSVAPFGSDVVPGSQSTTLAAVAGLKAKAGEQLLLFLPKGAARGTWHTLGITCKGETISIRLDGRDLQTLNDGSVGFGNFALFAFNTVALFDDLQLTYFKVPDLAKGLAANLKVLQPPDKPEAIIYYRLPEDSDLTVQVMDDKNKMVNLLTKGRHSAGINSVVWDGQVLTGRRTPPGMYTIVLQTPKLKQSLKLRMSPR